MLQLATRLIAPDKYKHFSDAKRPSTKSNMQITNGSSYNWASRYPLLNDWQNFPISNLANYSARKQKKSSGLSSLCIGNRFDALMDESDKISSEQKQENTVITISQSPPLSHDQTQSVCIIESQLPIYGNTPQNTDYIHNKAKITINLMSIYQVVTLNNPYNLKRAKSSIDPMSVAKNPSFHNKVLVIKMLIVNELGNQHIKV